MTIKELKQKIESLPDNMEVFMDERVSEFRYGLVNSGFVKEIPFSEDPLDEPMSYDSVFILSEE